MQGRRIENNKKNVLIFAGALINNGLTSSLLSLLDNVDSEKYNFCILSMEILSKEKS